MSLPITTEQQAEIEVLRATTHITRRPTVQAVEEILYTAIPILNHGFIRVIDYMGDDNAIIQAARLSYGAGTRKISEDRGLINYLMRLRHTTPSEMCEIKFHIKMPIFVARQWVRHRMASINEYSARYSILDREFYVPEDDHMATQSNVNRQGRGNLLTATQAEEVRRLLIEDAERSYDHYVYLLNEDDHGNVVDESRDGLARELARMNLSLNFYTQWYWKVDLHNLLHFLGLRADSHAQFEIRVYAEKILEILSLWVPITHDAFLEHRLHSLTLSRSMKKVVTKMLESAASILTHEDIRTCYAENTISKREWNEIMDQFGGSMEKFKVG